MKVYNNEITIHRGETFTIDRVIQNRDGSPYIIFNPQSEDAEARLLISVARNYYGVNETEPYRLNIWLKPSQMFTHSSRPFNLKSLMTERNGTTPHYPNGFSDITAMAGASTATKVGTYIAEGWIGSDWYGVNSSDDVVFYVEDDEGNIEYKYATSDSWKTGTPITWHDYECRITYAFDQSVTSEWIAQNYLYSISLVYGNINKSAASDEDPFTVKNAVIPILSPTKLTVLNTINGGF